MRNISFGYDSQDVLKDISLQFPKGEFTSIVGPNGSGKSTLLKAISSVLKPRESSVFLDGSDLASISKKEIARIMSVVPQNTALEFDYKVVDVVLMGRYPYIKRFKGETVLDKEIAKENMEYTNTWYLKDRSFNELSGGERQRVILAQALTQQPKILLLDEPISHLDLQHQIEILNLIKKLSMDQSLTVIAVLHDLNMAANYSDNIVMMKDGQVRYEGAPTEALTAEHIKYIFNIDVQVEVSPLTNKPYIYSMAAPKIKKNNVKVHIICGGGSGNEIISNLHTSGFEISSGVLSVGDLDWKISKDLDLQIAEDIPFSRISDAAYATNRKLCEVADYIVMTDFYIGKANVPNLKVLLESGLLDKPVLILGDDSFGSRDFTGGAAAEFYSQIRGRQASRTVSLEEMYKLLSEAGDRND
jgi:iron complex transport system ATP-binding protein